MDKGDMKYDFERFGSVKYQVHLNKERGTRKHDTFGQTFDKYEKSVVNTGLNHYLGKGIKTHNGLGPSELSKITAHVKTSAARLPNLTADRGLLSPSNK